MSGSPNRPGLTAFGPFPKQNPIPVKNPKTQLDAGMMSLLIWQVAGAGLVMPKVWAALDGTSGLVLNAHGEIWNPNGSVSPPLVTYSAVGRYSVQYGSVFEDENGNAIASNLQFPIAIPLSPPAQPFGSIPHRNAAASITDFTVAVELKSADASTYVDGPVLLLVW